MGIICKKSNSVIGIVAIMLWSVSFSFASTKMQNVYLDKDVKGIENIEHLAKDKSAFQLIAHGRPGELLINGEWKDEEALAIFLKSQISFRNESELKSQIQHINIYGCEFAKGEKGLQAVKYLENKLGISVAASNNITGKDGDWILEVGQPVAAITVSNYKDNLQYGATTCMNAQTVTMNFSGGVVTSGTGTSVGSTIKYSNVLIGATQQVDAVFTLNSLNFGSSTIQSNVNFQYDVPGATIGFENNFQPSFVANNGSTMSPYPALGTYILTNQWTVNFYLAGTSTPVSLPIIVEVFDNDGASSYNINEITTFNTTPNAIVTSAAGATPTTETITGNTATSNNTGISGITNALQYMVYANYASVSSFQFTFKDSIQISATGFSFGSRFHSMIIGCQNPGATNFPALVDPDYESGAVSSTTGGVAINNVAENDSISGVQVTLGAGGNATISAISFPSGISLDTITGSITVLPGTAVGTYPVTYQLCDTLTPINCITQVDTIYVLVDTDGDGISDLTDIDDDNDGILDAVESPGCFYTSTEAAAISKVSTGLTGTTVNSVVQTVGNNIPTLYDGVSTSVTASNHVVPANLLGSTSSIIYNVEYPGAINLATLSVVGATANWGTGAFAVLEASNDGSSFTTISNPLAISTGTTKTWTVVAPHTTSFYKYFRIRVSTVGSTQPTFTNYEITRTLGTATYIASTNPKPSCTGSDADGDGIPNHLDLDSDNDGCSDAKEARVTSLVTTTAAPAGMGATTGLANSVAPSPYSGNGFSDALQATTDTNTYKGTYTYTIALDSTLNMCIDSDNDGVGNVIDLDDDNDGILDAVESPSCFYADSVALIQNISSPFTTTDNFSLLHNGILETTTTAGFNFTTAVAAGSNLPGTNIFTITYPYAVQLNNITTTENISSTTGATAAIYGSNDGVTWLPLTTTTQNIQISTGATWTLNQNLGAYKYYTIQTAAPVGGAAIAIADFIGEIKASVNQFISSAYPKATCNSDFDGDSIPNYLDLDSDGDGCPDALEGQAPITTANITNSTMSGGNTGTSYTGIVNYPVVSNLGNNVGSTTYTMGVPSIAGTGQYIGTSQDALAQDSSCSCTDSTKYGMFCDFDGDGVPNYVDIDDDNDGILDVIENGCLYGGLTNVSATANRSFAEAGNEPPTWFYSTNLSVANEPNMVRAFVVDVTTTVTLPLTQTVTNPIISISNADYMKQVWTDQDGNPVTFLPIDVTAETRVSGDTIFDINDCTVSNGYSAAGTFMAIGTFTSFTVKFIPNTTGLSTCNAPDGNSIGIFSQCTSYLDTDEDGIPNQFDLDSDGDGCSDAYEGNATTDSTITTFSGPYGTNGYANSLETIIQYASGFSGPVSIVDDTYNAFAIWSTINKCGGPDTDGDGIPDYTDLDDDNDGILDAVESPSCYMTAAEQPMTGDRTNVPGFYITSDIRWLSANPLEYAINGTNTDALNAGEGNGFTQLYGAEAFRLTFPNPVQLTSVNVFYGEANQTPFRGTFYVRGSNDGVNWSRLSSDIVLTSNFPQDPVFTINQNTGNYKFYDLYSDTEIDSWWPGNFEVTTTLNTTNYIPSAHPKVTLCTTDTDGDSIPNQLDLDSDGDGCSDAYESGTATSNIDTIAGPYSGNGFADALQSVTDSNAYKGTYTYQYAKDSILSMCVDTDGDSIPDLIDLDDDNDGVLDEVECPKQKYIYNGSMEEYVACPNLSTNATIALATGWSAYKYDGQLMVNNSTCYSPAPGPVSSGWPLSTHLPSGYDGTNWMGIHSLSATDGEAVENTLLTTMPAGCYHLSLAAGYVVDGSFYNSNSKILVEGVTSGGVAYTLGEINVTNLMTSTNPNWVVYDLNFTSTQSFEKIRLSARRYTGANGYMYFDYLGIEDCITQVCDDDGDGIPNTLDLDSDGDGCSDAKESGVTSLVATTPAPAGMGATTGLANSVAPSPYSGNGFSDALQSATDSNTYKGTYTYQYAISKSYSICADTDGDGISDIIDLDDDNDGILDAIESPSCYYTSAEWLSGDRSDIIITAGLVSPATATNYDDVSKLVDGDNGTSTTSYAVNFLGIAFSTPAPTTVYQFEMPMPVQLDTIFLGYANTSTHFGNGNVLKLQGFNNGDTAWTDLNAGLTYNTTTAINGVSSVPGVTGTVNANYFPVTQNAGKYQYYRIYWVSGGSVNSLGYSNEVYFSTNTGYVPSANPKLSCTTDTDGDSILNHLDLDSDGDGCSDAKEAGVSALVTTTSAPAGMGATTGLANSVAPSPYSGNGFADALQSATDSNAYKGIYTYE
jgi:hypothetical protein